LVKTARQEIEKEKANAMSDIKTQVAALSIDIAEKVLRSELSNKDKQAEIVEEHMKQSRLS
jgi:F-type H+-transporting ATPase subunit b